MVLLRTLLRFQGRQFSSSLNIVIKEPEIPHLFHVTLVDYQTFGILHSTSINSKHHTDLWSITPFERNLCNITLSMQVLNKKR